MTRRHSRATLRIQHKLDRMALDDLRVLAQEQAGEIEDLRRRLRWAEESADSWRDDALRAIEDAGMQPGLTMNGTLVGVPQHGITQ